MDRLLANITHSSLYGPDGKIIGFHTDVWDLDNGRITYLIGVGSKLESLSRFDFQRGTVDFAADDLVRCFLQSTCYLDGLETQMPVYALKSGLFHDYVTSGVNPRELPLFRISLAGLTDEHFDGQRIHANLLKGLYMSVERKLEKARNEDVQWSL
jgi:hypothetical protein